MVRFIPNPNDYDNEKDYMTACFPIVKREHPDWTDEHISGACHGMWDEKGKHEQIKNFEPPQSGDAPQGVKSILDTVYSSCRQRWVSEHPDDRENAANKESCSRIAWDAVHKAGWAKGDDGKWHKQENQSIANSSESKEAFMIECIFEKYPLMRGVCEEEWKKRIEEPNPQLPVKPQQIPGGGQDGGAVPGQNKKQGDRVLMHLCSSKLDFSTNMDKPEKYNIERSTILVGDGTYNGVYFPADEIEKAHLTWNKQPLNLDHSDKVEDIVGYVTEAFYDKNTKKFSVKPIIDSQLPKSNIAKGYINSRLDAGSIPEVSVGVWVDRVDESLDEGKTRLTARNLIGDHLALVTRGACSPQDGCGIGLKNDSVTITLNEKGEYEDEIEYYENRIKQLKGGK